MYEIVIYSVLGLIAFAAVQTALAAIIYVVFFKTFNKEKSSACNSFFKIYEKINYFLLGGATLMVFSPMEEVLGYLKYVFMAAGFLGLLALQRLFYNYIYSKYPYKYDF
ncbi:MAG: hypothetical protein PHT69_14725 [Bacteroidales bacterium]|nr:hypothetical protein [Bacteroidales bacterium]